MHKAGHILGKRDGWLTLIYTILISHTIELKIIKECPDCTPAFLVHFETKDIASRSLEGIRDDV